jgi:hypothetical protein
MKTIQYGPHPFVTASPIANELLEYAEALATRQRSAIVEIPVVVDGAAATARLLIGHGIPLASITRSADPSWAGEGFAEDRDEFGSSITDVDPAEAVIGELIARRSTHSLIEAARLTRAGETPKRIDGAGVADQSEPGVPMEQDDVDRESTGGTVTAIADGAPQRRTRAERSEQGDERH